MKLFLALIIFVCAFSGAYAQDTIQTNSKEKPWKYEQKYQSVMNYKFIKEGMTDDEIAGILLYKAGKSFTKSLAYEIIGLIAVGVGTYIYPNEKTMGTVVAVGGGVFLFAGIVHLFTASNRTANAGIVLMHKGQIQVKAAPGSISVNF